MLGLGAMVGFWGGGEPKVLTYQTALTNASNLTTYNFNATAVGAEAPGRRIIVACAGTRGAGRTLDSMTIGGVSATRLEHAVGGATAVVAIFIAELAAGTTANISATFSSDMDNCSIMVWSATGLPSSTPVATGKDEDSSDPLTATLSTSAGGFCIAAAVGRGTVTSVTWTNVSERADGSVETTHTYSGADAVTDGSNITPSADWASAPTNGALAAVTF